jgi:flagellar basal-body rod modification protein FlgD
MSSIAPTSGTSSAAPNTQLKSDQLSMQQFMQLLVSQLKNQDPLDPMSDSDFFAQMAQLGQVQGMDTLNQASQLQEAQGMLGKNVTATASGLNGNAINGTVSSISVNAGVYSLDVTDASGNTTTVSLSNIQSIQP